MDTITIHRGNIEKAITENSSLIKGIGRSPGGIYVEYESSSKGKRHLLLGQINAKDILVYHNCTAVSKPKPTPCWHLGVLGIVLTKKYGYVPPIHATIQKIQPPPGGLITKDLTPDLLGRPGDYQLLELIEDDRPDTEEEPTGVPGLPEGDGWLALYRLPPKVLEKVLAFRERQKNVLTDEQKSRVPKARYIPSGNEVAYAAAAMVYGENGNNWEAPLLIGPKGSGKSTLAETLAAIFMLPVNKIFGGIDINAEALLGARTLVPVEGIDLFTEAKLRAACKTAGLNAEAMVDKLKGSQMRVQFEPGILLNAVEKGEMLVIDEVNMLVPEVTSLLHGLLDWQKVLSVPGYGVVKAPPGFRLVGCMNFGYAGTKTLNEAFQDRFRSVQVPHLPGETLAGLIAQETGCDELSARKLADLFGELTKGVENGDLSERVLSVRALFRIAREEMDGCGNIKKVASSVLTDSLNDKYEADKINDLVNAVF